MVVQETSQGLGEDGGVEYVSIGDDVAVFHARSADPNDIDDALASHGWRRVSDWRDYGNGEMNAEVAPARGEYESPSWPTQT